MLYIGQLGQIGDRTRKMEALAKPKATDSLACNATVAVVATYVGQRSRGAREEGKQQGRKTAGKGRQGEGRQGRKTGRQPMRGGAPCSGAHLNIVALDNPTVVERRLNHTTYAPWGKGDRQRG